MRTSPVFFLIAGPALCSAALLGPLWARPEPEAPHIATALRAEGELESAPHGAGNIYAPEVRLDGGHWRMWYGGQGKDGHDRIALAVSLDGKRWTKQGVALRDDRANHVNDPSVVRVGRRWFMYYTRTERDVIDRIHVAVSDDGRSWRPHGEALGPGPAGAWDALSVGRPAVIHEQGVFRMWYDGRRDFPPGSPVKDVPLSPASRRSVGYATSRDGLRWTKHEGPVFGEDAGAVDVKRIGDRLILLYEGVEGVRYAVSADGLHWRARGLLTKRSGTPLDAFGHVTPSLLLPPTGDEALLFVGAAAARTWDRNSIAVLPLSRRDLRQKLKPPLEASPS